MMTNLVNLVKWQRSAISGKKHRASQELSGLGKEKAREAHTHNHNGGSNYVPFLADAPLHVDHTLLDVHRRQVAAMDLDEAVVAVVSKQNIDLTLRLICTAFIFID